MPRSPTVRLTTLGSALFLIGACGSRTPLDAEPTEDQPPDVGDSGADAADVAADAAPDADPRCLTDSRLIGEIPIDLFFALDRSRSMSTIDRGSTLTRWQAISAAMSTFIASPQSAGLGAGITFFPRTTGNGAAFCSAGDYAFPVVPIGTLPGVAPSMLKAISVQTLASSTPTTPALEGSHLYARSHQLMQREHTAAIVLVTDGAPRDCGSSVATTSTVAAAAAMGSPSIRTYVLGVGPNLTNLNAIARSGGTEQAYLVETSGEANLLAALEAIRTSAQHCEYVLPDGTKRPPDGDVRVSTTVAADGVTTAVYQVPNAAACAGGVGWFYDVESGIPSKILLCPASCTPLVKGTGNRLDVAIGCGKP